jgi:uridylate kinase
MDMASIALAQENKLPIKVFSIKEPHNFLKVIKGEGDYTKIE